MNTTRDRSCCATAPRIAWRTCPSVRTSSGAVLEAGLASKESSFTTAKALSPSLIVVRRSDLIVGCLARVVRGFEQLRQLALDLIEEAIGSLHQAPACAEGDLARDGRPVTIRPAE